MRQSKFLRYPKEFVRHPSLLFYSLAHPSRHQLIQRWTELEMRKPVMQEMRRSALANAGQTFALGGETYQYFYDDYNLTWCNERTVEIPIIWRAVCENKERRVLEVGNVLSHYFSTSHLVVDKYERNPKV